MATQINGMSYGDIKYKDGNTVENVKEIWYKDVNGYAYLIWPNQYWADNIEIVDLTTNSTISYSVYNGDPIYTIGNSTLPGLIPNHDYAITGTIKRGDGSIDQDVDDCYFFHITTQGSGSDCWVSMNNSDSYRATNNFTGELNYYAVYTADTTITNRLSEEVFVAYYVPGSGGSELKLLGFGHYSSNFQNATPIILKRISIQQELKFYDAATGGSEITGQIQDEPNTTVSLYPKWYKTSSDDNSWSSLETASTNDFSYTISNSCDATVSIQNGVVSVNIGTTGGYVSFTYNNGNNTKTLYITPTQTGSYSAWSGGNIINTTSSNPIVLTQPFTFWIKDDVTQQPYSGNNYSFSVASGDSSAVSISGTTISPSRDPSKLNATATITGTVEGVTITNGFDVKVGNVVTYYKAGILNMNDYSISGSINTWNSTNSVTWNNPSTNNTFGIELYEDSNGNTPVSIYCDALSTAPFYGSVSNSQIMITYSGSGSNSITIPIYTDSSKSNQLGSITITVS